MNQTGLLIALAIAVVAGLAFGLYPQLDLDLVSPFYDPATGWAVGGRGWVLVRNTASWLIALIVAPAAVSLLGKIVRPHKTTLMPPRHALLMLLTLALGPGLLANTILKDNWGRPRPIEVTEFGGPLKFLPWWDPRGPCPKNCSFIAGEPSGASGRWRRPRSLRRNGARSPMGRARIRHALGLVRAGGGGHFFSDVVFAGVFMFLLIWVMHGLLLRWRKDGSQSAK